MLITFSVFLLYYFGVDSSAGEVGLTQMFHDTQARESAISAQDWLILEDGEPLETSIALANGGPSGWRDTTDDDMISRTGYHVSANYRFHRNVQIDLDQDGAPDTATLIESPASRGIRVTYGDKSKISRIIDFKDGGWSDQGLFPIGKNAFMLNNPESSGVFIFEDKGVIMAKYSGE